MNYWSILIAFHIFHYTPSELISFSYKLNVAYVQSLWIARDSSGTFSLIYLLSSDHVDSLLTQLSPRIAC